MFNGNYLNAQAPFHNDHNFFLILNGNYLHAQVPFYNDHQFLFSLIIQAGRERELFLRRTPVESLN